MRFVTLSFTIAAILFAHLALHGLRGALQGLPLAPLYAGPLAITAFVSLLVKRTVSQTVLLVSSAAYLVWLWLAYIASFHWHANEETGVALLFVGIYSLPIMIPLWIVAWRLRKPVAGF